jgi:hypothetical protein
VRRWALRGAWAGVCLAVVAAWLGLPLWAAVALVVVVGGAVVGHP